MSRPVSTIEQGRLRELAEAARGLRMIPRTRLHGAQYKPWPSAKDLDHDGFGVWFGEPVDDAYIAALSPATVIRLLDQIDRNNVAADGDAAGPALDVERLREVIVDTMLNDGPDDTVYDIADRVVARLAAPAEQQKASGDGDE